MKFEYPEFLWYLLAVVPGLVAFFWWSWRKKRRLISQFVQSRLLAQLTVGVSAARQKARMTLLVTAAALLVIVLARPQWGFDWEEVRQRGLDIVIAIDTSKSMLAGDIPPNRLQRSKLAALDLLKQARTDRVGLVAFAGGAFLQCPLSLDDEAFKQSLEALNVGIIPEGGTALAEAIEAARSAFKEKNDNYKVVVIFSDGEDHDGRAVEVAKDAAKAGLLIFTVGIGTPGGEVLRVRDAKGSEDYIRDESGQVVKSRLNERLLREVAEASGGLYVRLGGGETLKQLYESRLAPLPKAELSARQIRRWHERYQWFLGAVIVLLLIEMFVPERKRVPRSEALLNATPKAGIRKALTLVALLALPATLLAASPGVALKQYESKRYEPAYREYQRLLKEKPDDPRLHYNAGASAYQARNYEAALEHLQSALAAEDLEIQQRAYYNLGNTEFRLGEEESDLQKREQHWQQATNSYGSALRLGTNDVDARFNLDLVRQKLEELKQQQQQQQQQSKDDKQDQKDQKDQENKQDQQKQQDQQQQKDQKQDQQQQPKPDEQQGKKPEDQQPSKDGSDPKDQKEDKAKQGQKPEDQGDKPDQDQAQAGKMTPMQMTPQQAAQLLDAHKGEERLLLFTPQLLRTNRQNLRGKDW